MRSTTPTGSFIRRNGNPGRWFADRERSGGGPLIDIGVHIFDLRWYLMGTPKTLLISANSYSHLGNRANVTSLGRYTVSDYDPTANSIEDMMNGLIRFGNGASLAVGVSYSPACIINIAPQIDPLSFDFDSGFQNEIDHLAPARSGCRASPPTPNRCREIVPS